MRTYSKHWASGARRIPERVLFIIGKVISLIVHNIEQGRICSRSSNAEECLLLYNLQPLIYFEGTLYCAVDMLIKPYAEIDETHILVGRPLQLIVNAETSEVMNNTKGMLDMKMIDHTDLKEDSDLELPASYGFFSNYLAVASFMALESNTPMSVEDIFQGKCDYDLRVHDAKVFDSHLEAQEALYKTGCICQLIIEIDGPKEHSKLIVQNGLSKKIVKIIDPIKLKIEVPFTCSEARVEDEVARLNESLSEEPFSKEEEWNS